LRDSTNLKIVYRRIDALKADPANPRRHTEKQIRQIADSIEAFDFNVPILTDGERNIVVGHGRFFACRLLGRTEVPTLCLDRLTPEQARAFRIADNRLTEISTWDEAGGLDIVVPEVSAGPAFSKNGDLWIGCWPSNSRNSRCTAWRRADRALAGSPANGVAKRST
jgi:hypothetical protein